MTRWNGTNPTAIIGAIVFAVLMVFTLGHALGKMMGWWQ